MHTVLHMQSTCNALSGPALLQCSHILAAGLNNLVQTLKCHPYQPLTMHCKEDLNPRRDSVAS